MSITLMACLMAGMVHAGEYDSSDMKGPTIAMVQPDNVTKALPVTVVEKPQVEYTSVSEAYSAMHNMKLDPALIQHMKPQSVRVVSKAVGNLAYDTVKALALIEREAFETGTIDADAEADVRKRAQVALACVKSAKSAVEKLREEADGDDGNPKLYGDYKNNAKILEVIEADLETALKFSGMKARYSAWSRIESDRNDDSVSASAANADAKLQASISSNSADISSNAADIEADRKERDALAAEQMAENPPESLIFSWAGGKFYWNREPGQPRLSDRAMVVAVKSDGINQYQTAVAFEMTFMPDSRKHTYLVKLDNRRYKQVIANPEVMIGNIEAKLIESNPGPNETVESSFNTMQQTVKTMTATSPGRLIFCRRHWNGAVTKIYEGGEQYRP